MAAEAPMQVEVPAPASEASEQPVPAAADAPEQAETPAPCTQVGQESTEAPVLPAASVEPAAGLAAPGAQDLGVPMSALVKPDKPKKSTSAYWIYSNALREELTQELKEKGQSARSSDLAKVFSQRWKDLPEAERKVYEDKAVADRERFDSEMQVYQEACDPSAALRNKYKLLIPQRPLNPQSLFNKDANNRERALATLQSEGKDEKYVSSKLSEMWRDLSPEERTAYQMEHTKLQLEFLELQRAWQATPEFKEIENAEKAQQGVQKALEAAMAAVEARRKEEEARATKRARQDSRKTHETPPKRARGGQSSTPPPGAKKGQDVVSIRIDDKVLKEASKLGLAAALENLAGRAEIVSSRKNARAVLDALKASGGLVNPAKRVLLGL